MSVDYASKYSSLVDERFKEASLTAAAVNNDYDFDGVNTINIYEVDTAPMNNYTTTGSNRYGSPSELGTGKQTVVLGQDRSFTYTIDKKSEQDTTGAMEAGASLRRQVDEVVIPERDQYNLAKMIYSTGYINGTTITSSNAYEYFLKCRANIRKNKAPINGLIAFVNTEFYQAIKLDSHFVKSGDIAQNMLINGQVGKIDNVAIVEVPDEYLNGAVIVMVHPVATTAVEKLNEYKLHTDAPGISGTLVEGRIRYDAFVRKNKKGAIAVQMGVVTNGTSTAGTVAAGDSVITLGDVDAELLIRAGFELYYKTGASQTTIAVGTDCSSGYTKVTATSLNNGFTIGSLTTDQYIAFAFVDSDKKCVVPVDRIKITAKAAG